MAIIDNGLEAVVMRNKMESKDALAAKGSLYVGTGGTTTVTKANGDEVEIPETTVFEPEEIDGGVMIRDTSADNATGWKVDKVDKDNIKDAAVTPEKLDSGQTYTMASLETSGMEIRAEEIKCTPAEGGETYSYALPPTTGTLVVASEWVDCRSGHFDVKEGDVVMFWFQPSKTVETLMNYSGFYTTPPMVVRTPTTGSVGEAIRSPIMDMHQPDSGLAETYYFWIELSVRKTGDRLYAFISCYYAKFDEQNTAHLSSFQEAYYCKLK